jgi:hypothetical protein
MVDVLAAVRVTDPVAVIVGVGFGVLNKRMHTSTDDCRPAVIGTSDTWPLEYTAARHTIGDGAAGSGVGVAVPATGQKATSAVPHRLVSSCVGSQTPSKASTTKLTNPAGSWVIVTCRPNKGFTATRQQVVLGGKSFETDCSSTLTVSSPAGIAVPGPNPEQASAFWDCAAGSSQRTRNANPPLPPSPAPPEPPAQPTDPNAHAAARAISTRRAGPISTCRRDVHARLAQPRGATAARTDPHCVAEPYRAASALVFRAASPAWVQPPMVARSRRHCERAELLSRRVRLNAVSKINARLPARGPRRVPLTRPAFGRPNVERSCSSVD